MSGVRFLIKTQHAKLLACLICFEKDRKTVMGLGGFWLVGAGAALWGTIGLFVDALQQLGFTSLQITLLRTGTAGLILLIYAFLWRRDQLRINWRDLPYFLGTGICSIAFFNWCYFQAMQGLRQHRINHIHPPHHDAQFRVQQTHSVYSRHGCRRKKSRQLRLKYTGH